METNPYEYDTTIPWMPQQNQVVEDRDATASASRRHLSVEYTPIPPHAEWDQKILQPARMPKAQAVALARTFKKWLIVASLVSFGTLSGLVAYHQLNVPANQAPSGPAQVTPATPSSSGGFFDQQGGNNFGSSNSSQGPVSGSSVS
jgi:hypothetical protein